MIQQMNSAQLSNSISYNFIVQMISMRILFVK